VFLLVALFLCSKNGASANANSTAHANSHAPAASKISLSTDDRIHAASWWPTKGTASRADFAGTAECAKCHEQIAVTQRATPMAQASTPAANSPILRSHSDLTDQRAAYRYELSTIGDAVKFSVAEGADSLSASVEWAFGLGHKGQTYLYERNGEFYESHLSFYKNLQALDLTTGHNENDTDDLKSAMGRWLDASEARRCFGCHTTASTTAEKFDASHLTPGVQCESCHGPGAAHVAAMKSGKIEQGRAAILNPRRLDAVASVDFCGACHRTWADVILTQPPGSANVMNVRFQPYRLEDSKCWRNSQSDARLTCTTCHNPHEQLVQDLASYDAKCLSCHTPSPSLPSKAPNNSATTTNAAPSIAPETKIKIANLLESQPQSQKSKPQSPLTHTIAICPVSKSNCVSCHMPQVEVPTVHATFFDHRIRIVRSNSPYPM
jgi:hypothetical protein